MDSDNIYMYIQSYYFYFMQLSYLKLNRIGKLYKNNIRIKLKYDIRKIYI